MNATSVGSKDGPHPRPIASYRLTAEGRQHLRSARPKQHFYELLENQEAVILLKFFMNQEKDYAPT